MRKGGINPTNVKEKAYIDYKQLSYNKAIV